MKTQPDHTPAGRLLVRYGFEPYDAKRFWGSSGPLPGPQSAARRVAEKAADDISELTEVLKFSMDAEHDKLSALLENDNAENDDIREAALDLIGSVMAFQQMRRAVLAKHAAPPAPTPPRDSTADLVRLIKLLKEHESAGGWPENLTAHVDTVLAQHSTTAPAMLAEARVELLRRVLDKAFDETESWRDDQLGMALAYLAKAVVSGGSVDWTSENGNPDTATALAQFRAWFAPSDPVWLFIEADQT